MCQCLLKSHGAAMSLCHTLVSDRDFPVIGFNSSSCGGICSSTKLMLPALYHTMMSMKNAQRRIAPVVPVGSNICYLRVLNAIINVITRYLPCLLMIFTIRFWCKAKGLSFCHKLHERPLYQRLSKLNLQVLKSYIVSLTRITECQCTTQTVFLWNPQEDERHLHHRIQWIFLLSLRQCQRERSILWNASLCIQKPTLFIVIMLGKVNNILSHQNGWLRF
jgi:hypothetical protein